MFNLIWAANIWILLEPANIIEHKSQLFFTFALLTQKGIYSKILKCPADTAG